MSPNLPSCPVFTKVRTPHFPLTDFFPSIYLAWPIPSWCLIPRGYEPTQLFSPFNSLLPPGLGQSAVSEHQMGGAHGWWPPNIKRLHLHSRLQLSPCLRLPVSLALSCFFHSLFPEPTPPVNLMYLKPCSDPTSRESYLRQRPLHLSG